MALLGIVGPVVVIRKVFSKVSARHVLSFASLFEGYFTAKRESPDKSKNYRAFMVSREKSGKICGP